MYLLFILIYLLFILLVVLICHRLGVGRLGKISVTVALLLAPFWDMILAKGIMWNYAWKNIPLQKIVRTVEKPESVLWLDEVWPGYDAYGRHWMVTNYLDGVHLTQLALNGEDGKIYLYRATLADFVYSERIRPEYERLKRKVRRLEREAGQTGLSGGDNRQMWKIIRQEYYPRLKSFGYEKMRREEVDRIFARPAVYQSLADVPVMHYRIDLKRNRLSNWEEQFVWCDEIRIQDNLKHEEIAFSKRCLGYNPGLGRIGFNQITNSPESFSGGVRLGDERVYEFDDKVLFGYTGLKGGFESKRSEFRRGLYGQFSRGWERRYKKLRGKKDAK